MKTVDARAQLQLSFMLILMMSLNYNSISRLLSASELITNPIRPTRALIGGEDGGGGEMEFHH